MTPRAPRTTPAKPAPEVEPEAPEVEPEQASEHDEEQVPEAWTCPECFPSGPPEGALTWGCSHEAG